MINEFFLEGLNDDNQYQSYLINLKDNTYILNVYWDKYNECAYLNILNYQNKPIVMGKALVNNLVIRNHNLPYILYFIQINGEAYEPTIDNIATEFAFAYNDEKEVV